MHLFSRRTRIGTAWAYDEGHAAKLNEIATPIVFFCGFARRIELLCKLLEVTVPEIQAHLEPIFATCIGFGGGSISD